MSAPENEEVNGDPLVDSNGNGVHIRENYIRQNKISLETISVESLRSNAAIEVDHSTWMIEAKVPFCDQCIHKVKHFYVKLGLKHLVPVLLLAFYSLIGAGAFYALESSNELSTLRKNRDILSSAKRQMIERVWELKLENLTRRKILYYANEALNWYEGISKDLDIAERQWDFWGAIFYCGTIYTTIGYGNIVPKTFGGKLLTLFYAALGIPLVFFILNDLGDVLGRGIHRVWTKLKQSILCQNRSIPQLDENMSFKSTATSVEMASVHDLPMTVALSIALTWMFLCSAVFCIWENWDYFQAFHFFFVSLTTVGLGDTVPVHHQNMIMSFGLILLGMSLVSMCIQVAQAKVEHLAQQIMDRLMKRYQACQLDNVEEDIERTLDQTAAPSWIRALLTRKKKEKLVKELKRRKKMRVVGTQTDSSHKQISTSGCQTEVDQNWKAAYERKLSVAQDLLKHLEFKYTSLVKDKKDGKCKSASIRSKKAVDEDETPSPLRNSKFRIPKRMSSFRGKLSFRGSKCQSNTNLSEDASRQPLVNGYMENDKPQVFEMEAAERTGGLVNEMSRGEKKFERVDFVPSSQRNMKDDASSLSGLSCYGTPLLEKTSGHLIPVTKSVGLQSEVHAYPGKTVVLVEEEVDETVKREHRSAITRWIRRLAHKPNSPIRRRARDEQLSMRSHAHSANEIQLLSKNQPTKQCEERSTQCSLSYNQSESDRDEDTAFSVTPSSFGASSGAQSTITQVKENPEGLCGSGATSANAAVQCGGYAGTRFLHVPYVLDDCKVLFKAIQKRLTECQSILTGEIVDRDQAETSDLVN